MSDDDLIRRGDAVAQCYGYEDDAIADRIRALPAARPLPADVAGLVERILSMPHRMDCGLLGGYDGGCTCGHDQAVADVEAQAQQIAGLTARAEKAEAENARLREALINAAAHLATVARSDQMGSPQKWQCQAWADDALAALKGGDNG